MDLTEAENIKKRWQEYTEELYKKGMDLTEAENIKKRWEEYTEELYKKDLHDPDNHDGVKWWAGWSTNWNPDCQEKYQ